MFEIRLTQSAENDLRDIHDYLQNELFNPLASDNLRTRILRSFEILSENPDAYPACQDSRLKRLGYHKCTLGGYLFVYRIEKAASVVNVIRFFHGLQNWIVEL